jgi:signal transduction histidine kinase
MICPGAGQLYQVPTQGGRFSSRPPDVTRCMTVRHACLLALFALGIASPSWGQTGRVVLLYDERTDFPGLAALDNRLTRTLTVGLPGVEIYREAMDLSRFQSERYPALLEEYLRAKYADKKIDVVIAAMGPALDFLLANGSRLFPGASIVFCGIDRRDFGDRRLPVNVTGVLLKREFAPTLKLALALHPGTRRVLFISGASPFDRRLTDAAKADFRANANQVAIEYLTGLPWPRLADTLATLPPRTIVLASTMFRDSAGGAFIPHEVVERIATTANAPVYAFVDQYLGRGIVGGHLYSMDAHGEEAARMALRIMGGALPSQTPIVERSASVDMFDWRQLRRWGISERRLPVGSVVRFRDTSLWARYRTVVLTTIAALLLQSVLIVAMVLERRTRQRAQAALQTAELLAAEQRRELSHLGRVAVVGELSGALAHEINQPLAAILANARAAQRLLRDTGPPTAELRAILDDIESDDRRAAAVIRRVRGLVKKDEGETQLLSVNEVVGEALELAHTDLLHRGVSVNTRLSPSSPLVYADRVHLQQVLLNLIMNACDAMSDMPPDERALAISTEANDGLVRIAVRDRGSGIPPESLESVFEPFVTTKKHGLGLGLAICRSIITAHGGDMSAANNPDRGATIVVSLPLAGESRPFVAATWLAPALSRESFDAERREPGQGQAVDSARQ